MPNARRCIVRPAPSPVLSNQQRDHQIEKLRTRLSQERTSLARWQTRLKRAFTTVEKHQKRIGRLERQIAFLED
jgi:lipid II:glycine glycyltransferase (peptidoglycan interpeptide bridge formation enzyme)